MKPAIFLDRDNTLIANEGDLGDPALVQLREGVPEGLRALREAGFRLIVVTNQAGVARGAYSEADVDSVHQRIAELVDEAARVRGLIDRFYYCPYHPEGTVPEYQRDHPWRKPHPGMLLQAASDLQLDLARSWLIGDQQRDIAAGRSAGCRTVLLSADDRQARQAGATASAGTFHSAVGIILGERVRGAPAPPVSPNGRRTESQPALTETTPANSPDRVGAGTSTSAPTEVTLLRRAVAELSDELRSRRVQRGEFTAARMAAGVCQLLVLLFAMLGLLQLGNPTLYMSWMIGAVLVQLLAIALLVLDLRA